MHHAIFALLIALVARTHALEVCRNLALDQARTTSSSEVIFSFEVGGGGSAAHNTDSDVSALLDPSDNSRLRDSAYFSLTLTPSSTQLMSIEYVQPVDDTDDSAGIMLTAADASITKTGDVLKVLIPQQSYVNPTVAPWTDMRSLKLTFSNPNSSEETKVSLVKLCDDFASPSFCSITTTDEYKTSCSDCNCQTCHNCGCTTSSPWGSCSHSSCGDCWCSPVCKCCQDCDGYTCNCQDCCDAATTTGCSLGSTYKVSSLHPANGIASATTDVVITGEGFYRNAESMTCNFGGVSVPATFVSSTSVNCGAPPISLSASEDSKSVRFSLSLDGGVESTDPTTHSFTYVKCPSGCSDTCAAEECRCDTGKFGSSCQFTCTCQHGACGSLSGFCSCDSGWTGQNCDVECPGGHSNPCNSDRGACYFDVDGGVSTCECYDGFWDVDCSKDCPKDSSGAVCGGHGSCEEDTGRCLCAPGYYGNDCEMSCPGRENGGAGGGAGCNGNGVCCTQQGSSLTYTPCNDVPLGQCACNAGYSGSSCSSKYCYDGCFGNGVCIDGSCDCMEGWSGEFCSVLSGSDPSKSYFAFDTEEIFTNEEVGTVKVNVTRYGSLEHDVSVYYSTLDLTANAGEDYVAVQNRLMWPAENAEVKTVKIMILKNSGVAEGEESFQLQLSQPTEYYSALGKVFKLTIKIAAKDEDQGEKDTKVARITVRVLKDFSSSNHEVIKASFVGATLDATSIPHGNLYLASNSIEYASEGVINLTFDILNIGSADVNKLSKEFVDAIGDPDSAMYNEDMRVNCPIDIGFQPEVQMVIRNPSPPEGNVKPVAVILPILFTLSFLCTLGYYYRRPLRNYTLRKLAQWKFSEMRDDDLSGDGGQNPMHGGILQGVIGQFRSVKDRYFGLNQGGYDGFRESEDDLQMSEGVRHSSSIDDGSDDSNIVYDKDGNEIATMGKARGVGEEVGGGEKLLTTKKVLQIEL
ncbi:hypothetical protein TrLO_g180 [Triparma laevis f. longispina]|uniref:EGF-like domain-containing protein n=1 Tax=Triparma laevis f. longispina TaxID=1714387 RepID=A0A9W6ZJZ5_9STRA|nr:hypothetical protein TrLO_g180 [Triparma laevis f. longispina]